MHMWMWFGYDLGDFLFNGLRVDTTWAFAITWIVLFFTALLFEGSKVYLAKVQRDAHKKLFPYRSDERRNLLCHDREPLEPSTSRNPSQGQVSRWSSMKVRFMVNFYQALVFLVHNVVGYLLMLAVMIYNVHLLLAVVFGMMLGYFLFGPKLTRLQMQCFSRQRVIICTPECDDSAENTTPPLLDSASSTESDFFICRTRTCIQPSHYFSSQTQDGGEPTATCYYGAKVCPSKVARAKKMQAQACHHTESEKEESPSVEDAQLLRTERQGCCKKKQEPPPEEKKCCKKSSQQINVDVHDVSCCKKEEVPIAETSAREHQSESPHSPVVSCCHKAGPSTDSQEQMLQ